MNKEFLSLLSCPNCKRPLKSEIIREEGPYIAEGLLHCECNSVYPIIEDIPRMVNDIIDLYPDFCKKYKDKIQKGKLNTDIAEYLKPGELQLKKDTQLSFSYQWLTFSQMSKDFKENFLNYIYPIEPSFFVGKFGLDAGCGFGRHIYNAAKFGARMIGMDYSRAIEATYRNTSHLENVFLVQGDIYHPPLNKGSFDFIYSIGVLHHLPQPELGFRALVELVKPKGAIFIWVYSDKRKFTIIILEMVRKITHRLPFSFLKVLCYGIALIDYSTIRLCFWLRKIPYSKKYIDRIIFPRISVYEKYPFQVNFADWFDRLSAPIRFYYNENEIRQWYLNAGLTNIKISPTGYYGLRAYGEKK